MNNPLAVAERVIIFLEALAEPEKEQGAEAAKIIRHSISKLAADREAALTSLQYDLSWKGVLDWQWSNETNAKLEAMCKEYWVSTRGGA